MGPEECITSPSGDQEVFLEKVVSRLTHAATQKQEGVCEGEQGQADGMGKARWGLTSKHAEPGTVALRKVTAHPRLLRHPVNALSPFCNY